MSDDVIYFLLLNLYREKCSTSSLYIYIRNIEISYLLENKRGGVQTNVGIICYQISIPDTFKSMDASTVLTTAGPFKIFQDIMGQGGYVLKVGRQPQPPLRLLLMAHLTPNTKNHYSAFTQH